MLVMCTCCFTLVFTNVNNTHRCCNHVVLPHLNNYDIPYCGYINEINK